MNDLSKFEQEIKEAEQEKQDGWKTVTKAILLNNANKFENIQTQSPNYREILLKKLTSDYNSQGSNVIMKSNTFLENAPETKRRVLGKKWTRLERDYDY